MHNVWLICVVYLIDRMKFQNDSKLLYVKSERTLILTYIFKIKFSFCTID